MNVKEAIENYLAILTSDEGEETDRIKKLILSLDELALLSHKVNATFDDRDYPDPPARDYEADYQSIGKLFPSLGYYNVALDVSENIGQASLAIGDATDDIVDIAGDLKEVLWYFKNTSEQDALFNFQFLFGIHWGRHLRYLQLYLHDKFKA
jgi:hypothetical protein